MLVSRGHSIPFSREGGGGRQGGQPHVPAAISFPSSFPHRSSFHGPCVRRARAAPADRVRCHVQVDQQFSRHKGRATCGTTATTVILRDDAIHVAHCGDSRAILVSDNGAWPLTKDHKPSDPLEAERIRVRAPSLQCRRQPTRSRPAAAAHRFCGACAPGCGDARRS